MSDSTQLRSTTRRSDVAAACSGRARPSDQEDAPAQACRDIKFTSAPPVAPSPTAPGELPPDPCAEAGDRVTKEAPVDALGEGARLHADKCREKFRTSSVARSNIFSEPSPASHALTMWSDRADVAAALAARTRAQAPKRRLRLLGVFAFDDEKAGRRRPFNAARGRSVVEGLQQTASTAPLQLRLAALADVKRAPTTSIARARADERELRRLRARVSPDDEPEERGPSRRGLPPCATEADDKVGMASPLRLKSLRGSRAARRSSTCRRGVWTSGGPRGIEPALAAKMPLRSVDAFAACTSGRRRRERRRADLGDG